MPHFRFNPWWELENLSKEMEKIVDTIKSPENRPRVSFGGFNPRVDITEDEKNIYFEIEVPGVRKEDVKVKVSDDNIISIQGEKKLEKKEDESKTFYRNERQYGDFNRSFQLPELVDATRIEAKYENGILNLSVPKLEPVKPKEQEIEIK